MLKKAAKVVGVIIALSCGSVGSAQTSTEVFSDDFSQDTGDWQPFDIDGSTGSLDVINNALQVTLESGEVYGAYYSPTPFSGHFDVVVEFENEQGVAFGLIREMGGQPSIDNYSMIQFAENAGGNLVVSLSDMQFGNEDVFDNTNLADRGRYSQVLNGSVFSIPFDKTAKKLRIMRHAGEQFLHFYYAVEKSLKGELKQDWIELAPSKEWGVPNGSYYIGAFSVDGTVTFDNVKVTQLPLNDQPDINTGFTILKRPYTWSGYTADALVISFGDAFPYASDDRKFVFWELANNIPVWHVSSSALFAYGFLETWDGGNPGCHEPMSDRLLGHTELEIIEDNSVRKVVRWSYDLINPDYKVPTNDVGTQRPEAIEYFYIYADGSIIRKMQYAPKLDSDFRNWHEMMEMILVAGQNQRPGNLLETPSLTFHELGKAPQQHNNDGETTFRNHNARLGATTTIAHIKNSPDIFNSFSDDLSIPETHTALPLNYEITWHWRGHNFGHWPINREPYLANDPCKNWSSWPQQVAHTSLVGMGVDLGRDWDSDFLEREDGRRFREWISLIGMGNEESATAEDKTNSWLFPGGVQLLNDSASFKEYSHEDKYFEFETTTEKPACYFETTPKTRLVNPVLRINQWGNNPVNININGKRLNSSQFITSIDESGDLLLMILGNYGNKVQFELSTTPIEETFILGTDERTNDIQIFPNPVNEGSVNIFFKNLSLTDVYLLTMEGKVIRKESFQSGNHQLNIDGLSPGLYAIKLDSEDGVVTKKILVK